MASVARATGSWIPAVGQGARLSGDRAAEALREYVDNPLFRSAETGSLVIDDNPYRRPVWPVDEDLPRLDEPMSRENVAAIGGLLSHRMLLNIYDTRRALVPDTMTDDKWRDFDLFYGPDNQERGECVRPMLERYAFGFVHEMTSEATIEGISDVDDLLREVAAQRSRHADDLVSIVSSAQRPERVAAMLTVQLVASALNAPLQITPTMVDRSVDAATGRGLEADTADVAGGLGGLIADLCVLLDIGWQVHQYYQFYLATTLALMNYLNAAQHDHGRVFAYLGAMTARTIDHAALAVAANGPDGGLRAAAAPGTRNPWRRRSPHAGRGRGRAQDMAGWLRQNVAEPIAYRCGERGLREFARGVAEYTVLLAAQHEDVCTQLRWVEGDAVYQRRAERLHMAIASRANPVTVERAVDSWEESATTHVHDEDRLLVVESGELEFSNGIGHTVTMRAGDVVFVPKHRLHGSVAPTGHCVYRQPIVTSEVTELYG